MQGDALGRSSGPPRCRMVAVAALAAVTGGWIVGPAQLAAAAALRAGRAPAALPAAASPSASASASSPSPSSRTWCTRQRRTARPAEGTVMIRRSRPRAPPSPWSAPRRSSWPPAVGGSSPPPRRGTAGRGGLPGRHRADHHRHRQRHRRLLRARRRAGAADLRQHHAQGDRRRDRRVGAEHPAAGRRRVRHRVLAGRHGGRRGRAAQGAFTEPQQVQALARIYSNYTHVVVPAAVRDHHDGRLPGQADLHRLARSRAPR